MIGANRDAAADRKWASVNLRKLKRRFPAYLLGTILLASLTAVSLGWSRTGSGNSAIYGELDLFGEVLDRVRSAYVEKPDDKKLVRSAIDGMLSALDPHSSYLDPEEVEQMQAEVEGEFGGLGLDVTADKGSIKVVAPIAGTPAAKAGLRSGDRITALDGMPIAGMTLADAIEKMRGPVNKSITLTILRKGRVPYNVRIVRRVIRIKSVSYKAKGDVGYVHVSSFSEHTPVELINAILSLKKQIGPKLAGYVLDLRDDPGGLLDAAIAVSDDFLERGAIVTTRGRASDASERANATPGDITQGKRLVVLINGGSASASEIVAGALQDHRRATLVGTRSFGKGSVQTIIPLDGGGALRLTTARYYTPSGRSIQAEGIEPDVVIEEPTPTAASDKSSPTDGGEASLRGHLRPSGNATTEEKDGSSSYVPSSESEDTQLNYALQLLRNTQESSATQASRTHAKPGLQSDQHAS